MVSAENLNQNILKNKIIYVSTSGNDSSGNGSLEKPYRTISFVLENANRCDEIILRGSAELSSNIYNEFIRIGEPEIHISSMDGEWAVIQFPLNDEEIDTRVHFDVDSSGSSIKNVEITGGYYFTLE